MRQLEKWVIVPTGVSSMLIEGRCVKTGEVVSTEDIQCRIGAYRVVTVGGACYQLRGHLDWDACFEAGIPLHILDKFKNGVPPKWKRIIHGWSTTAPREDNRCVKHRTPGPHKSLTATLPVSVPGTHRSVSLLDGQHKFNLSSAQVDLRSFPQIAPGRGTHRAPQGERREMSDNQVDDMIKKNQLHLKHLSALLNPLPKFANFETDVQKLPITEICSTPVHSAPVTRKSSSSKQDKDLMSEAKAKTEDAPVLLSKGTAPSVVASCSGMQPPAPKLQSDGKVPARKTSEAAIVTRRRSASCPGLVQLGDSRKAQVHVHSPSVQRSEHEPFTSKELNPEMVAQPGSSSKQEKDLMREARPKTEDAHLLVTKGSASPEVAPCSGMQPPSPKLQSDGKVPARKACGAANVTKLRSASCPGMIHFGESSKAQAHGHSPSIQQSEHEALQSKVLNPQMAAEPWSSSKQEQGIMSQARAKTEDVSVLVTNGTASSEVTACSGNQPPAPKLQSHVKVPARRTNEAAMATRRRSSSCPELVQLENSSKAQVHLHSPSVQRSQHEALRSKEPNQEELAEPGASERRKENKREGSMTAGKPAVNAMQVHTSACAAESTFTRSPQPMTRRGSLQSTKQGREEEHSKQTRGRSPVRAKCSGNHPHQDPLTLRPRKEKEKAASLSPSPPRPELHSTMSFALGCTRSGRRYARESTHKGLTKQESKQSRGRSPERAKRSRKHQHTDSLSRNSGKEKGKVAGPSSSPPRPELRSTMSFALGCTRSGRRYARKSTVLVSRNPRSADASPVREKLDLKSSFSRGNCSNGFEHSSASEVQKK